MDPKEIYLKRFKEYSDIVSQLDKQSGFYSTLRLVSFVGGFVLTILAFVYISSFYGFITMTLSLVLFVFLVVKHQLIIDKARRYGNLAQINKRCISRMDGSWTEFSDRGTEYINPEHVYSNDLNVFGHASLFQWLNTSNTFYGYETLRHLLECPEKKKDQITKRQNAIKELAGKIDFCQSMQCEGMSVEDSSKDPGKLLKFSEDKTKIFRKKLAAQMFYVLPELTILSIVICFIDSSVSIYIPLLLLLVQAIINIVWMGKLKLTLSPVNFYKGKIKVYQKMIEMIEKEEFKDEYLNELKSKLYDKKKPASARIKGLERIVDAIDVGEGSIVAIILNFLVFWNFHCVFALESWRARSGRSIRTWLETIGMFEALASLALVPQMNPAWTFPVISKKQVSFTADKMAHPLIYESKRICNSINMDNQICVVTGSNMSGKTTLLRTIGINLVLAYAGTAVCAKEMECSVMDIYTSMRVTDDLSGGISTFYAELLRIKMIIDHSRKKQPMIFLIDEVFRGTNSVDRVTGARNVVLNLDKDWIIGLISTHDFELCGLEQEKGSRVVNYYFTETYSNNEIRFDYVLRRGRCKTTNAKYLMKMVGIELVDQ